MNSRRSCSQECKLECTLRIKLNKKISIFIQCLDFLTCKCGHRRFVEILWTAHIVLNSWECWMAAVGKKQCSQCEEIISRMEFGHRMMWGTRAKIHYGPNGNENYGSGCGANGDYGSQPSKFKWK